MNFCVAPREIPKIKKRGGQNKLQGCLQKLQKNKRPPPPVYFEPESGNTNLPIICEKTVQNFFMTS